MLDPWFGSIFRQKFEEVSFNRNHSFLFFYNPRLSFSAGKQMKIISTHKTLLQLILMYNIISRIKSNMLLLPCYNNLHTISKNGCLGARCDGVQNDCAFLAKFKTFRSHVFCHEEWQLFRFLSLWNHRFRTCFELSGYLRFAARL